MRSSSAAVCVFLFMLLPAHAQEIPTQPSESFTVGRVLEILSQTTDEFAGLTREVQLVRIQLDSGETIEIENGILPGRGDMELREGEKVVISKLSLVDGGTRYLIRDKYRLPSLLLLGFFFVLLCILLGGWTGFSSLLGLLVSIGVLMGFVLPGVAKGYSPLPLALGGCMLIAVSSLYLAHGFSRRTSVALLSTIITLACSALFALLGVHFASLFGMGTEESLYLQLGSTASVDLRGLLLAGITIGCLGVLDDITTAQTAVVDEIRRANPSMSTAKLWKAGSSVGREHIASLINTLALAYVGTSLPLLLLFHTQETSPWWMIMNSEFLAEEIIRTLVGSTTLLLAVPISTWCAVKLLHGTGPRGHSGHSHVHGGIMVD